ncbi:SCO3374 family protein [Streptomyces sp. NPDC019990]|uniref:SCO3374 family protein n=1 Tax=Streptomyces sp. NPDC019990 TaxID=3154693 RepID=UPI0033F7AAB8
MIASGPQAVPPPRRPLGTYDHACGRLAASGPVRRWYENELGWPTLPGDPVRLMVGTRFDVLDVPAEAGRAALRRLGPGSAVALRGDRMRFLVAPGSAEELPGLLEWLEWGTLELDLRTVGRGGAMEAPLPPCGAGGPVLGEGKGPSPRTALPLSCAADGRSPRETGDPWPAETGSRGGRRLATGQGGSQGAAVWLRPPEPGREVEASLPTLSALGGSTCAPDLVRLVDTVATHCHRVRLRRTCVQPPPWRAQDR